MNRKSLILIILLILLALGLGVAGTIGVQKLFFKSSGQSTSTASQAKVKGALLPLGEFTVNLQGGSFLKTSITVEVTDEKTKELFKEEDAFLKDRVNTVLMNKSIVDVQTKEAREKLREELVKSLKEVADDKVLDVLFVSLVYQ